MHKSQKVLQQEIDEAAKKVKIGAVYTHYKSAEMRYKVLGLAISTQDGNGVCVMYEALYDEHVTFVRSLQEWLGDVEINGKKVKRFTLQ